jgi:hypothetical protein
LIGAAVIAASIGFVNITLGSAIVERRVESPFSSIINSAWSNLPAAAFDRQGPGIARARFAA